MRSRTRLAPSLMILAACAVAIAAPALAADAPAVPRVKVVALDPGDASYLLLLGGPPETASMRSGLVTLAPGKAIGRHDTETYEEMLVPLAGEGELRLAGQAPIRIHPGMITYAPAHTEHDVVNTGSGTLRYIFIVAKAE